MSASEFSELFRTFIPALYTISSLIFDRNLPHLRDLQASHVPTYNRRFGFTIFTCSGSSHEDSSEFLHPEKKLVNMLNKSLKVRREKYSGLAKLHLPFNINGPFHARKILRYDY